MPPRYRVTTSQRNSSLVAHSFSMAAMVDFCTSLNLSAATSFVASCTFLVTSVISASWFSSMPGQRASSAVVFAKKPSRLKSFFMLPERFSMQLRAQWWLVITRPSAETTDALQPPAMRTDERRT